MKRMSFAASVAVLACVGCYPQTVVVTNPMADGGPESGAADVAPHDAVQEAGADALAEAAPADGESGTDARVIDVMDVAEAVDTRLDVASDLAGDLAIDTASDEAMDVGPESSCSDGAIACDAGCATLSSDPLNCGACGHTCTAPANAMPTCTSGTCGSACLTGYSTCGTACVDFMTDSANCGGCGIGCTRAGTSCYGGLCIFASTGAEGPFSPMTTNVVLPGGIHNFTSITIPATATVTSDGNGPLDLRATGPVVIYGVIDVSGGTPGTTYMTTTWGGGDTGVPAGMSTDHCAPSTGGSGAPGSPGGGASGACGGAGGQYGGGSGGLYNTAGGGGGGYAGGGGGATIGLNGGNGASAAGSNGGAGGTGASATQNEPGGSGGVAPGPYAGLPGASGTPNTGNGGGGGGGSIGAAAAADLPMATTFYSGSGGGGGGGDQYGVVPGSGGGGAGGALRIASAVSITVASSATIRANGGPGGVYQDAGGGGGSGGAIYLAAPMMAVYGTVTAVGGSGGVGSGISTAAVQGGAGGLGRIRLSAGGTCSLSGSTFTPSVNASCSVSSGPGTLGATYIGDYPY